MLTKIKPDFLFSQRLIMSGVGFLVMVIVGTSGNSQAQEQTMSPEVVYASYFGGSGSDFVYDMAKSPDGTIIVVGFTSSPSFPGTNASPQSRDAFVSKITLPTNSTEQGQVLWTVFIGGSYLDQASDVAVGPDGRIYVVGTTFSDDFPVVNPLYTGGSLDNFLAILDSDGNVLTSTRIGGSSSEANHPGLALDSDGNIYISCETLSRDFPSGNPGSVLGASQAVVVKLSESNNVLTEVLGFTYGGSGNEYGNEIAVDAAGNIYLAGGTLSSDLITKDALQANFAGGVSDTYVAVFSPTGALETATYLGGTDYDNLHGIAVDVDGNVHIWGRTSSTDMPVVNAFQANFGGGSEDGFVAVLTPFAKSIQASSYLGGSDRDRVFAFARDENGNLIYAGQSLSDDFIPQQPGGSTAGIGKSTIEPAASGYIFSEWRMTDMGVEIRQEMPFAKRFFGDKAERLVVTAMLYSKEKGRFSWTLTGSFMGEITTTANALQPIHPGNITLDYVGGITRLEVLDYVQSPPMTHANLIQSATTRDPINLFTGELFFLEAPDLYLGGPMPLIFERYYASHLGQDAKIRSALGTNWLHRFDGKLTRISDTRIEIVTYRGRIIEFEQTNGAWELRGKRDVPFQLVESGANFILGDPRSNRLWTFDDTGKWVKIEDGRGNAHTLSYSNGRLASISDGLGRTLTFTYDAENRLTGVSDGTRTVAYQHTGSNLTGVTDASGKTTTYAYDEAHSIPGLLTSKTLPRGNVPYSQTYDAEGRVVTQTDANGNKHRFQYNKTRTPMETVVTDAFGNTETYFHDAEGKNTAIQSKTGQTITQGYDGTGRRNALTDRNNNAFSYTYHDPSGLATQINRADGSIVSLEYTAREVAGLMFYDPAAITFPDGTREQFTYDASGNLISWTDRAGNPWNYTYNGRGQVVTVSNPLGGTITNSYNANGTLASMTDEFGQKTAFDYDAFDRLVRINRPDGSSRIFMYDASDRLLSLTDERGSQIIFDYDANGNLTGLTDPLGNRTSYAYEGLDRLVQITDPLGNVSSRTYDALGRLNRLTNENGHTFTMQYDVLNNLVSLTDPAGGTWSQGYDAEGVLTRTTDPLGNTRMYSADKMGRLNQRAEPGSGNAQLEFDAMGQLTSVQGANGQLTTLQYDANGYLNRMTLAGGIMGQYTRDALGNVTRIVDGRGSAWNFTRDTRGRITARTDPLGRTATHAYHSRGWLEKMTFPGGMGSVTFERDGLGNVTAKAFSDGTRLQFQYDAAGRLIAADGLALEYDANDRLIGSNGIRIERDAAGRMIRMTLPDGKTVEYTYDERNLPITITDWLQQTTRLTFDPVGRLTQIERPNGVTTTFTYDANGYLVGIEEGGLSTIQLTRNDGGQIVAAEREVPLPLKLNADTQNLAYDAASQVEQFRFDHLGRRTGDDWRSYSWNLASQLESYSESGKQVRFEYDAVGQLTSRVSEGERHEYIWNYTLPIPVLSVERCEGSDFRYYIHSTDGMLLYSINAANGQVRFYHYDERGNTLFLTDASGRIVSRYAYTPYGRIAGMAGESGHLFTFQGKYGVMQEGETGLFYMRARYYDAISRQFISEDPVASFHPRSMSLYQFAYGNPMRFADPLGLDGLLDMDAARDQEGWDFIKSFEFIERLINMDNPWNSGFFAGTATATKQAPVVEPAPVSQPATRTRPSTTPVVDRESPFINPDFTGSALGLGFAAGETFFKRQGRAIVRTGLQSGNFSGLARAGRRAAFTKAAGTVLGGAWGAWNEYKQAQKEGQGGTATAVRTVASGLADGALGLASAPVAIGDALTGGNISNSLKQAIRVPVAALEGYQSLRRLESAIKRGEHGAVVKFVYGAGETLTNWLSRD
ncbi:MAG: RHS repeat-associated core domain-containing protein [candidate division KSB1 bacterium]|nr:RHS repeat-associated core domain-containing protein [candidate division KSB1 bacterium]